MLARKRYQSGRLKDYPAAGGEQFIDKIPSLRICVAEINSDLQKLKMWSRPRLKDIKVLEGVTEKW